MYVFKEKNAQTTYLKTKILDITYDVGHITEYFPHNYTAYSYENKALLNGDTFTFMSYKEAENAIVGVFRKEFGL